MTSFPHCPEHIRPILDEFLEAMRLVMGRPDYFPGPSDFGRWKAKSHELYNNFNGYQKGFILWAVPQHAKNLERWAKEKGLKISNKYIADPMTVRYLWEVYEDSLKEGGQSFDELMDEALEKDRRKSKWR